LSDYFSIVRILERILNPAELTALIYRSIVIIHFKLSIIHYNLSIMTIITILQTITALLLIPCILIQNRASGLSATFGGGGALQVQRRGAEKLIFKLTIILSVLFFGLAVAQWYI
jgi:protein translocase SecG subunit